MELPSLIFLLITAGFTLLSMLPGLRLRLDFWLSGHQKQRLREVLTRPEMEEDEFVIWMKREASSEEVVSKVRHRVAEGVAELVGRSISRSRIYPQDRLVADLGIDAGPDLGGAALIMAVENDLGVAISDEEVEMVDTVEDLIHLCERHLAS